MKTQYCKSIHACLTEIGICCNNKTLYPPHSAASLILMLDIHFNYICAIYIYKRVEMWEGPASHRGTVERMIVTPSSLFCYGAYLRVRLAICELTLC